MGTLVGRVKPPPCNGASGEDPTIEEKDAEEDGDIRTGEEASSSRFSEMETFRGGDEAAEADVEAKRWESGGLCNGRVSRRRITWVFLGEPSGVLASNEENKREAVVKVVVVGTRARSFGSAVMGTGDVVASYERAPIVCLPAAPPLLLTLPVAPPTSLSWLLVSLAGTEELLGVLEQL